MNPETIVRRNSIIYQCATPDPCTALLFGNGRVGGSVHTPDDSLYLLISRGDLWNSDNTMGAIAAVRIRGKTGLVAKARSVRQECNLYEAVIRISLETEEGPVAFRITCARGQDLIVVDIDDEETSPASFHVCLENWHEGDSTTIDDSGILESIHVNRSSCFEEANRKVGIDTRQAGLNDPLLGRAWALLINADGAKAAGQDRLVLNPARHHRVLIAAVCQPLLPGVDPETEIRKRGRALVTASARDIDCRLAEHTRYWRDFWSRSYVALSSNTGDAEYEERLWYIALYTIACGSGGDYPMRFNGGPYLLDRDQRSWDRGYWFQNMRELYWPMPATGHWEFMNDFFRMYFDAQAFVAMQTRNLFGIDALCYRETQSSWGLDVDSDLINRKFGEATYRYFSSNLEICQLMEWYYLASGDDSFLQHKLYPFLKRILDFYLAYAKHEADGRYHLAPVNSLETWVDVKDDMVNICGLRTLLPRAIRWGRQFGETPSILERWRDFLENLADIPIGRWTVSSRFWDDRVNGIYPQQYCVQCEPSPDGIYTPAADKLKDRIVRRNMENAELYIIFPWGLIGMDSPPEVKRRAENTWNHRTWRLLNNGWAQDVVQLARMGWKEPAKTASLEHAGYNQRFPNGCFISPAGPHFHGLLTNTPYFDTAGSHMTGINEMLLQSYDGVIRIAPAVTREWSGRFKLHALGGFVVEADFIQGLPTAARITATRANPLRLRNYRRESMRAKQPSGAVSSIAAGDDVTCEMKPGDVLEVSWAGNREDTPLGDESARPDVLYPGYKIRPPLVAHSTGHWHDERKGHGQIGLYEDGLFPATRPSPAL